MVKTGHPEIVDCARMASSSVRKRRSARTGFSVRAGFANTGELRRIAAKSRVFKR
jgi:hypothetical protein